MARNKMQLTATKNEVTVLTPQQEQAITLLCAGKTKTATAAELGIDRATLWRWEQEPVYLAALGWVRLDVHNATADRLRSLRIKALDALEGLLDSDEATDRRFAIGLLLRVQLPDASTLGSADPEDYEIAAMQRESDKRRNSLFATMGL